MYSILLTSLKIFYSFFANVDFFYLHQNGVLNYSSVSHLIKILSIFKKKQCSDVCSSSNAQLPASYHREAVGKFILQQEKDSIEILVDQQRYFGHKNRKKDPTCADALSNYRALTFNQVFLANFRLFYFLRIRKVQDVNRMISLQSKI